MLNFGGCSALFGSGFYMILLITPENHHPSCCSGIHGGDNTPELFSPYIFLWGKVAFFCGIFPIFLGVEIPTLTFNSFLVHFLLGGDGKKVPT